MLALDVLQGIGVCHQVAAHTVGVDQLLDPGNLVDLVGRVHLQVRAPAHGLVRDAQGLEDFVVEVLGTEQQLVHKLQELAAAGSLDDAVVIGGRQREDLADGVLRDDLFAGTLELGRVVQSADADDGSLPLGQTRHGVNGADAAGVGQGNRGAGVVISSQLAGAGTLDQVFIGVPELGEVEGLRFLDVGHNEQAGAVRLGHVNGDAEVDVGRLDSTGLAVDFVVVDVHRRELGQCADHGVADEVREGNLAAACTGQVGVDDHTVIDQQLGRNSPDAGGRGDLEAGDHVGGDGLGRAAKNGDHVLFRSRGCLDVLGKLGGNRLGRASGPGLLRAIAGDRSGSFFCRRGGRGRRGGLCGRRRCRCSSCSCRSRRRRRYSRDFAGSWVGHGYRRASVGRRTAA